MLVKTTGNTPLDPGASVRTLVQQISLGPGPWTVLARAFAVDVTSDESDFVRCELFNQTTGKSIDASAGWVGSGYPANMITNLAKLRVASGATATIEPRRIRTGFRIPVREETTGSV